MHSSLRWRAKTRCHLSEEMALSLPSELDFYWPAEDIRRIIASQVVLVLPYRDFVGTEHLGQLVVHSDLADVVQEVFEILFTVGFPLGNMAPVAAFAWDDNRSMAANNCVGFHFRNKTGKEELSWHAYGRAIDINPLQNPYMRDGVILPAGARHDPFHRGTCDGHSLPVHLFKAHGFTWGGEWTSMKDYMHFEFPFPP
ncbi:MAG: M15 family metallopeptidase [Candidatus Moraniibacteriota bacterium]